MKPNVSILFLLIFCIFTGCVEHEPKKEFAFKNESENWVASISGTYSRGSSDIFEKSSAIFTYKGKENIKSIYITTYTSENSFESGTEVNEVTNGNSIETSFDNFGFWEAHEEGKDIIIEFEWREGDSNTKKKEKLILEKKE
ncbi:MULTISPECIES: hypothetical protein [Allobacillus]|uniref:Lipoprotein n=1 Tax=Allobacillus salarius TaxID=1955272 RepID=A0A556PPB1_9BACI|nr:hypothetical protein [Allobacillus salarius]TSJ66231.1 hypothetical protein FPQ13_05015 [Allobacillus salarius]